MIPLKNTTFLLLLIFALKFTVAPTRLRFVYVLLRLCSFSYAFHMHTCIIKAAKEARWILSADVENGRNNASVLFMGDRLFIQTFR